MLDVNEGNHGGMNVGFNTDGNYRYVNQLNVMEMQSSNKLWRFKQKKKANMIGLFVKGEKPAMFPLALRS